MKKYAFYLPQFHEIPENDLWWGKGFTEWVNVKKARPLFNGHKQPLIPLNQNYYCLLDKSTVEWQTSLMKKYSIDGMIYYHYYFKGKKLLEKPAENLLEWKDIDQPFFFCWANHSWNRSWEGEKTVLLEQQYGKAEDWEIHFQYLLPFFKDKRYEKKNNKPLFMLYNPEFTEKSEMIEYFDKKCRESGFNGIFIINTMNTLCKEKINCEHKIEEYIFVREPSTGKHLYENSKKYFFERAINKMKRSCYSKVFRKVCLPIYNGNRLYECSMSNIPFKNKNVIPGLFFSWDNTPRHGENGYIISEPSKKEVFQFLGKAKESEYIFINAWNEWCEGMILEPTAEDGYKYLEWIKEWTDMNDC